MEYDNDIQWDSMFLLERFCKFSHSEARVWSSEDFISYLL